MTGRTAERVRAEIRARFGFREATVADAEILTQWLRDHVAGEAGGEIEPMVDRLEGRCRELAIESPKADRVDRIVRAAIHAHEERFHADIHGRLSPATCQHLYELLRPDKDDASSEPDQIPGTAPAMLLKLCGDPGRPSLASIQEELAKLSLIRRIDLPSNLFDHASPRDLERCRRRVVVEAPHELRRHPDAARFTWLAAFVYLRGRILTDDLVDLLIETIHHIGARAERKVERKLLNDLKRVSGKQNLLFELADATLENSSKFFGASPCTADRKIHYLAGVACEDPDGVVGGQHLTLEAGEYAVIQVNDAGLLRDTWTWLLGHWLATSARREKNAPEFERFTSISEAGTPIGPVEIWIP